jgi:hypothetical protein
MIILENVGFTSLKIKMKLLRSFKEFKAFIENQIGKQIKVLRIDNRREFE